jgi:hypothetical protein
VRLRTVTLVVLAMLAASMPRDLARAQESPQAQPPQPPLPTVTGDHIARAILFHSQDCPHCGELIHRDLPPIQESFGDRLDIVPLLLEDPVGDILFQMAKERFLQPGEESGVPMVVIGNRLLIGARPIREQLPAIAQAHIDAGGVDWPDIPGLKEMLAQARGPSPTPPPTATETVAPTPTPASTPTFTPTAAPTATPTATPRPSISGRLLGGGRSAAAFAVLVALVVAVLVGLRVVRR